MKILVIDDSAYARKRLALILQGAGHTVVEADGGEAGLALLSREAVDAVTVDLLMPGMDGLEVMRRIRHDNDRIPILVVSSDVQERTVREVMAAGATAFVGKLAPREELIGAIANLTTTKRIEDISRAQLDMFTELINLSMGRAAQALERILDRHIRIKAPEVNILKPDRLRPFLETKAPRIGTAAEQAFTGEINGRGYLIFPVDHAEILVQTLLSQDRTLERLSAAEESILTEVANVILNAVVSDMGNRLNTRLRMGLPTVYFHLSSGKMAEIMLRKAIRNAQAAVVMSWLDIDQTTFVCYLVLITGAGDIQCLLESMERELS